MSEEINTSCYTLQKQSVQCTISGCRFGLFLFWQCFSSSVTFSFQKVPAVWPWCLNFFILNKVLRDSLSLGQFYKLKIPASLMTGSSAKSFNLIYKCFKVTEVQFFEGIKGTAGLPAIWFFNSLNGSRVFTFLCLKAQGSDGENPTHFLRHLTCHVFINSGLGFKNMTSALKSLPLAFHAASNWWSTLNWQAVVPLSIENANKTMPFKSPFFKTQLWLFCWKISNGLSSGMP